MGIQTASGYLRLPAASMLAVHHAVSYMERVQHNVIGVAEIAEKGYLSLSC